MDADRSPAYFERMAAENDDFTYIFWRVNPAGHIVRDAKIIEDAGNYDVAKLLFADAVDGTQIGLCAVLRGQVKTVDDFELANEPEMNDQWESLLDRLHFNRYMPGTRSYTVFGSWDTGDGYRRHSRHVEGAVSAVHAELIVRHGKTLGTFLVAGVVEGCVPNADPPEEKWATLDGTQPVPAAPKRPWWRVW